MEPMENSNGVEGVVVDEPQAQAQAQAIPTPIVITVDLDELVSAIDHIGSQLALISFGICLYIIAQKGLLRG